MGLEQEHEIEAWPWKGVTLPPKPGTAQPGDESMSARFLERAQHLLTSAER